jgi:hypothetical protein
MVTKAPRQRAEQRASGHGMDLRSAIARIPLAGPWLGLRRDLRIRALFDRVYKEHRLRSADSKSGPGSSLDQTAVIRDRLPKLLAKLGIKSVLDIPCGDLNWMQHVDLGSAHRCGYRRGHDRGQSAALRVSYAGIPRPRHHQRRAPAGRSDLLPGLSGASFEPAGSQGPQPDRGKPFHLFDSDVCRAHEELQPTAKWGRSTCAPCHFTFPRLC